MDLGQEIDRALRCGKGYDFLLELVRQYQARGLSAQASYDALEQLWRDSGFDEPGTGTQARDDLESVMEKIWFECPERA